MSVFKPCVFVADLGGVAGAKEKDFLANKDKGAIKDQTDYAGDDSQKRKKNCTCFDIACKDERLKDDAPSRSEDQHDAGFHAEQRGRNEQNCGADGKKP